MFHLRSTGLQLAISITVSHTTDHTISVECLTAHEVLKTYTCSLSARILHRAPPPRLQVDQNFLTQKIVADPKMRCHQKSFGIWRVTDHVFFFKKHILEKIHNKSNYFFNF